MMDAERIAAIRREVARIEEQFSIKFDEARDLPPDQVMSRGQAIMAEMIEALEECARKFGMPSELVTCAILRSSGHSLRTVN